MRSRLQSESCSHRPPAPATLMRGFAGKARGHRGAHARRGIGEQHVGPATAGHAVGVPTHRPQAVIKHAAPSAPARRPAIWSAMSRVMHVLVAGV